MREEIEQFKNPLPPPKSSEKHKPVPVEEQPSPGKKAFADAVEQIKTNDRAIKLLTLMVAGYLPNQEELHSIDVVRLVDELRKKYPTIEDVEKDLSEAVDEQIGVAFQEGWTREQYEQAIQEKKLQYKIEAVRGVISALGPVYERFGAVPSEENKARILENLTTTVEEVNPRNISSFQRDYVKKNLLAAVNQVLTPEEARRIIQTAQAFFEVWQQSFPGEPDPQIEDAIKKIKEKSGLALEELRDRLGIPEKETQSERFELRGTKIEIEYPGMPVEVYLADKRLQIIDVRNDPRWNADYLLIDPATFDQMNPTTGYKGIRENESFILGRNNPLRFEFPDTVSRTHLRIELNKGGKLIIEDLNSTNGTVVQLEGLRRPSKEQIEAQEASPERERAIAEFKEYVKKHQSEIERELQQGRDLDEIFYHDFYNNNIDQPKYREDDPAVQRLAREYSAQINTVRENLLREAQRGRGLMLMDNGYWLYCNTNGGFRSRAALGRFYFNLKPEYVAQVFYKTAQAFRDAGLHSQMKIPVAGDVRVFNRLDKMVVYFDSSEEQRVLQVLEKIYRSIPEAFDETGTPRFTAEVKNARGEKMTGIGFGEEPPFRNESFGTIRAKVLAEVYLDAKYSGRLVSDPNFDFETSFRRACLKYQVDPQNPAFNLQRGQKNFSELKRRMKAMA
jgi:hypothetical protein